jgi:hypothetical protein
MTLGKARAQADQAVGYASQNMGLDLGRADGMLLVAPLSLNCVDQPYSVQTGISAPAGERRYCPLRGDTEPIHLMKQLGVSEYWASPSRIWLRECTVRTPARYR